MALVLDTGALIAFDRGDRAVAALIEAARRREEPVRTSSGCVAQAWRGPRHPRLGALLAGVHEFGLTPDISRPIGAVLAAAGTSDVVDAHLAMLARNSDTVVTGDTADLAALLDELNCGARIHGC